MSGRGISLDLSHNPAVGAPNGLASMLGSGIGVARIVARECEMGDEGLLRSHLKFCMCFPQGSMTATAASSSVCRPLCIAVNHGKVQCPESA